MIKLPGRIELANLPTKIEKLERFSKELGGPNIYIKRDDQTGTEFSGNKVRKLEFTVKQALDMGCDMLITCGGIQSNHARATAAVAAKLGMSSYLVLRTKENIKPDGNHFIDKLLGANIKFITPEDYSNRRMEVMEELKEEMTLKGYKPYIIPEGASNGIGNFGYFKAMEEIIQQEKELGIKFDTIVTAVGSGGTYGGLILANELYEHDAKIYGINVCDDAEYFQNRIYCILNESVKYINKSLSMCKEEINIIDGYVGRGYALSRPEELEFIHEIGRLEGVILDPVYTGKAMYGLKDQIMKGNFKDSSNILFIHTGGLFGLFPKRDLYSL
jgi:D-cysteine desulfhydrase